MYNHFAVKLCIDLWFDGKLVEEDEEKILRKKQK